MELGLMSIVPVAGLFFSWAIVYGVLRNKQHRADAQRDVQLALLNKFASGDEMTRFLSTEEGRRLVDQLAAPTANDPRHRTAGMVIGGCIMTALSIGFLVLTFSGPRIGPFLIPAVICGALGVGIFAGAALSLRISKKLDLIKDR